MQPADEMSTEVMENAANAAAKRREVRRRRILMDPEERMRKLTGYNNLNEAPTQPMYNVDNNLNGLDAEPNVFTRLAPTEDFTSRFATDQQFGSTNTPIYERQLPQQFQPQSASFGTDPTLDNLFQAMQQTAAANANTQANTQTETPSGKIVPSLAFTRGRNFAFFVLGILVRVALAYSLGRRFIQSIINPFVFAEIAVVGYQRAVGMDLGSNARGGLFLSTMVLSGVRPDIIDAYKTSIGIITAILDDFSLYFFSFVVVHLICVIFV